MDADGYTFSSSIQTEQFDNITPHSATPTWILELMFDKSLGPGLKYWARITVYDASNAGAGVHAWPPTSRDVPNDYGDFPYTSDAIPENFSFGVTVALSSVAVLVGTYYLCGKAKNHNHQQNYSSTLAVKLAPIFLPFFAFETRES